MLRKLGAAALVLLLGVGAWLYHTFSQATALPAWYEAGELPIEEADPGELQWVVVPDSSEAASTQPSPASAKPKRARRELHNFHLSTALGNDHTRKAVRGSRAVFEDGELEAGVVINISKIDLKKLSKDDQRFYRRAMSAFPGVRDREVYLGIEDTPKRGGEFLQLGSDTKIRIGELRYSLPKVAKRLGLEPAQVRKQLNREFVRFKLVDPDSAPADPDNED